MSSSHQTLNYRAAVRDFDRARRQAALQQLMARITGKSAELLSYNEVQEKLHASGEVERGLREIPVDAIVGSVGRYKDFTRSFLPKRDIDEERWARVRSAVSDMTGMDPIEVYQVGAVYFVIDGNHRVSVARQLGTPTISAYVTEVKTRVPLHPGGDPKQVLEQAQYVDFLEKTQLDKQRPGADLFMKYFSRYNVLLEQIVAHRHFLGVEERESVSDTELAAHWYDEVYMPVIKLIRKQGVLRNFPELSETDLYVLFSERWEELQEDLGWKIGPETAVTQLAEIVGRRARSVFARAAQRVRELLVPDELEEGPAPGKWRRKRVAYGRQDRLFADYLVAISGTESDWHMVDEVIAMAQKENDRLLGLHVVRSKSKRNSKKARAIGEQFLERCQEAGILAEFAVDAGDVADKIIQRAAWVDLVVASLANRPDAQRLSRLSHGFSRLVQRCPRPLLAVPEGARIRMTRLLLAYDGSPKAQEALYVATYLASRWPIHLTVVTVETENTTEAALRHARRYIREHGVSDADYHLRRRPIAEAIKNVAEEIDATMLIMGGFGFRPVMHLVLGSTVDQILCEFGKPILICR